MSRLNYMEEEDEVLLALREDLAILERRKSSGREFTSEQKGQIRQLIGRLAQLVSNVDWTNDEQPNPDWLRRKEPPAMAHKRRA